MRYSHILFDADETLFSFNAQRGLEKLFAQYGIHFTEQDYQHYSQLNAPLWVQYQNGEIDAKTLHVTRFQHWAEKLDVAPQTLNDGFAWPKFAAATARCATGQCTLAIITNGFAALQRSPRAYRFSRSFQSRGDLRVGGSRQTRPQYFCPYV